MLENQERRSPHASRVTVKSLVEVCGQEPQSAAFEAEAMDVSARGMHLRTTYVPEKGQSLVCRFENRGRQILVEGQVAWCRDAQDGSGEFGVQFTALDGSSVDALKELYAPQQHEPSEEPELEQQEPQRVEAGMKVRLHIEGLAAPMKARVKDTSHRRLQVGSNLEFLTVGREIEVEALDDQANFSAVIDGVEVSIDPRTQVPQLLVTLRRPGLDVTPAPSVVNVGARAMAKPRADSQKGERVQLVDGSVDAEAVPGEMEEALSARELAELGQRMGQWAARAGGLAKGAGARILSLSSKAADGVGTAFQGARARIGKPTSEGAERARRTAPPPEGRFSALPQSKVSVRSASANGLRQQTRAVSPVKSAWSGAPPKLKLVVVGAASTLVLGLAVVGLRGGDGEENKGASAAATTAVAKEAVANTSAPGVAPLAATPEKPTKLAAVDPKQGIVAEVPLFGPTPMATLEAAPVTTPDEPETAMNEGERELALSRAAAQEDETFAEETKSVKPENVPPFQRGNLDLPVVYKMKLDAPAGELVGTPTPTGFKVSLPGRKVLDNGRAIEQRDRRILRVRTNNTKAGAEITFQFRGAVPGYKARLLKDGIDFFVSSAKGR